MDDISIKPTGLKYGLYYGAAAILYTLFTFVSNLVTNPLVSILAYILIIAAIVFGIKEYKKLNEGFISLKQGISLGVIISLIGTVLSGIFSIIYMTLINTDAKSQILEGLEEQLSAMPPESLDMMMGLYETMFEPIPMFFMGVVMALIGGVFWGLVIGAIMKNDRPPMSDDY